MNKQELRIKYLDIRKNIPDEKRKEESFKISKELLKLINENFFSAVLLYAPKKYEVDVLDVFEKINVPVYFPRCNKEDMNFYEVDDLSKLHLGYFNVREPEESCPLFIPKENEKYLIIVPGICFDRNGYRIGYGRGYYDKYLSKHNSAVFSSGINGIIPLSLNSSLYFELTTTSLDDFK